MIEKKELHWKTETILHSADCLFFQFTYPKYCKKICLYSGLFSIFWPKSGHFKAKIDSFLIFIIIFFNVNRLENGLAHIVNLSYCGIKSSIWVTILDRNVLCACFSFLLCATMNFFPVFCSNIYVIEKRII